MTLTQDSTSHDGSRVQAGGTAAFVATGVDANGNRTAGNLSIIGSDIDANKVALGAKNDVNIVSATNTDESHSTNKSSSASVGVSYGAQGFGVSASASKSKGNADTVGATQANSHINGQESVTIVSGNDTNILGATVGGGKVMADVGGNLNLASRQDTEESHARQESTGGGFSISQGGGSASVSASKGKADGSYANVSEQSGIYAGAGGFDINVKGNTDLKGAVIASDATKDKNSLTTGTLTFSDLQNHSDYSATSMGISAGGVVGNPNGQSNSGSTSGKNTGGINPMIPQHKSGSQDGVAQAAVADGTITITDGANQKQDLATLKRDTAGTNSQVGNNPDLENLLNKQADMMAAAQAAGEAVAKTVGDVAGAKQKEALANAESAGKAGNTELQQQYLAEAKSWEDGGEYRAALHAAGGALIAGLGGGNAIAGAAGAGAASLAGGKLNELSNAIADKGGNTALSEALGNVAANIAAGGIGALAGGSGAATAANVDRFNRQLHPDEKQLAKKMAANSGGKYTAEQIEAQMRLSSLVDMNGNVLESGRADVIDAVKTKPTDAGVQWQSIAGTTRIQEVQAQPNSEIITYIQSQQKAMQGDVPYISRQDYSSVPKITSSPGQLPAGKCGAGQADCAAGLPAGYSAEEIAQRRTNVADAASNFGTQVGRVGAVSGAFAASPNPIVAVPAAGIAMVSTAAGLAASAVEQVARPDVGQTMAEGTLGAIGYALGDRFPLMGPAINELGETIKATDSMTDLKNAINKGWNNIVTGK